MMIITILTNTKNRNVIEQALGGNQIEDYHINIRTIEDYDIPPNAPAKTKIESIIGSALSDNTNDFLFLLHVTDIFGDVPPGRVDVPYPRIKVYTFTHQLANDIFEHILKREIKELASLQ